MRSFILRFPILLIALVLAFGAPSIHAQEEEVVTNSQPGLESLDQAMQRKLSAVRLDDLEEVVKLCQRAIEEGLDGENEAFAKQMMSAALYEKASRLVEPVFEGEIDATWVRRREIAMSALRKVLKNDDSNGDALLLIARLCQLPRGDTEAGRLAADKAIDLLSQIPTRQSEAIVVRAQLAESTKEQLELLDKAIAIDEANVDAWRARGDAKLADGDVSGAIADFQKVLESDNSDLLAIEQLVRAFVTEGKMDEAIEQVNRVIEIDPESPAGYAIRSSIHILQDKNDDALDDLDSAIERDPGNIQILLSRAGLLEMNRSFEEALADVDHVLELRPGLSDALLMRAQISMSADRFDDAILALKELMERQPDRYEYKLQLAMIFAADSRPRRAVEVYNSILKSKGISEIIRWEALRGRADAGLSIGAHAEAVADYEAAMEIDGDDSGILNNLAWVLATTPKDGVRDGKRALEFAKRACELTDYKAAHILSTLAASYAELGDFEEARKWSEKAVDLGEGEIQEHLREELKSYEDEKPWRELQNENENPDPEPELGLSNDLLLDDEVRSDPGGVPLVH